MPQDQASTQSPTLAEIVLDKRQGPSVQRRVSTARWATFVAAVAEVATIGLYIYLYTQTQASQMLAAIGLASFALVGTLAALWLSHRRRLKSAGYVMLITFVLAFSGSEWFLKNLTEPLLISGLPAIFFIIIVFLPQQVAAWLLGFGLFLGNIWLAKQILPVKRYDLIEQAPINPFVPFGIIAALVGILVLFQILRNLRYGAIRTRLMTASIALILLLAVALTASSTYISFSSGGELVLGQLGLVANVKAGEIDDWVDGVLNDLDSVLDEEATKAVDLMLNAPAESQQFYLSESQLRRVVAQALDRSGQYKEIFILSANGVIVVSTDQARVGRIRRQYSYFQSGLKGTHLQSPALSIESGAIILMAAQPVLDESGEAIAVLAGRVNMEELERVIAQQVIPDQDIHVRLISGQRTLLAHSDAGPDQPEQIAPTGRYEIKSEGATMAVDEKVDGEIAYTNELNVPVLGALRWIPSLGAGLLVELEQAFAYRPIVTTILTNLGVGLGGALLAALIALTITRSITTPLTQLAQTAEEIAGGNLDLQVEVAREDEMAALAQAFNSMTSQLKTHFSSLEQRVADRTAELEQRSRYLEAAAKVGSRITTMLDADQLIRETVQLIRDRFGLYYVGLFLVDPAGTRAVLRAGTGEAGRTMIERGHQIQVGEGMIGWSVANAQPRVAQEAGEDAVRLATAELPETRSEAAIPLRSRGRVLGALTVQDRNPEAFDQDTIAVLQTMADQIAVALNNAELFTERKEALEAQRRAFGDLSREGWLELARDQRDWGYIFGGRTVQRVEGNWRPEMMQAAQTGGPILHKEQETPTLSVPLLVEGFPIGALNLTKASRNAPWSEDEIQLLESISEQIGAALENARLHHETQRRAVREQMISEVTSQLRTSLEMETILKTAVSEISEVLGLAALDVQLGLAPSGNGKQES